MTALQEKNLKTSQVHVLVVEDEPKVASFIKRGLEEQSYCVTIAYDGLIGEKMIRNQSFDLYILDINLPYMNGFELCKRVRSHRGLAPVIFLTALGATDNKLNGFESGADDYLVKPFEFLELLARVKALLKRTNANVVTSNILSIADLEMNLHTKIVKRNNKPIDLTSKEFALLEFLLVNQGKVVSRSEIAEKVWDVTFDTGTNVIEVYVNFLRKKIDKDYDQKLLHTLIGFGYILKE